MFIYLFALCIIGVLSHELEVSGLYSDPNWNENSNPHQNAPNPKVQRMLPPFEIGPLDPKWKSSNPGLLYLGKYNDKNYYVDQYNQMTWSERQKYCQQFNGSSVSFESEDEKYFVYNTPANLGNVWTGMYIGNWEIVNFRSEKSSRVVPAEVSAGYFGVKHASPGCSLTINYEESRMKLFIRLKSDRLYPVLVKFNYK